MSDVRVVNDIVQEAGASAGLAAEIFAWEAPPHAASPASAPVLAVEGFEGPLDWLLEMAQARKIDLTRLSIAALINAFAAALEAALAHQTDPGFPPLALAAAGRLARGQSGGGRC